MTEEKTGKKGTTTAVSKSPAKGGNKKAAGKEEVEDDSKMKPPRVLTPYIFFTTDVVPKIRAEKNCSNVDAMREAGARWNQLSEEGKAPYVEKTNKDKVRFDEQMKMFNSKGYFMLADGTKSTDYEGKQKKKVKSSISPASGKKRQSNGAPVVPGKAIAAAVASSRKGTSSNK
jgi:hypothetical protein